MHDLTIVVPFRNEPEALARLLRSLPEDLPVIVVDDQSERVPGPVERGSVKVIRTETRGYFSGAVNAGIQSCKTDVLVLNQDVWFENDQWLVEVREWQRAGHAIAGHGVLGHPAWPKGYVQGTLMFMSRAAIDRIGDLDENEWPLWGTTAEWQTRACRAGFTAHLVALPWLKHEKRPGGSRFGPSITRALEQEPKKRDLFIRTPPLISVIIPCYNYGRYVKDAISSLIGGPSCLGTQPGQTFQGFEVVIVDDASTDNSWQLIQEVVDPWKGIRAIRAEKNGGTASALNLGISGAFGRYVTILSADDMMSPKCLASFLAVVEGNPRAIPYADSSIFKGGKLTSVWRVGEYDFNRLLTRNMVPATIMMPKKAWEVAGKYPVTFGNGREDWAMAVALGRVGYCGVHLKETLLYYRREGQNRSLTNGHKREEFLTKLRAAFPDVYRGERPMGCCGGQRKANPVGIRSASMRVGETGMTLLEYVGSNAGRVIVTGPVTYQRYSVKGSNRVFYVDSRDASGILAMAMNHQQPFRVYVSPVVEPVKEVEPVMEALYLPEEEEDLIPLVDTESPPVATRARRARRVEAS